MKAHPACLRVGILALFATLLLACAGTPGEPDRELSGTATSADGVPIRYHAYGSGDLALVLVHGWSCDSRYWDSQVPDLRTRYRVVTLDLAGHGESGAGRNEWTMAAYGADVAAVTNKLGLRRVVLIGHSMGGPVVVEAARLLPGRVVGVIGADTLRDIGSTPMPAAQLEQLLVPFRRDFPAAARGFVTATFFTPKSDPKLIQWIADDMSQAPPGLAIASIISLVNWDWQAALSGQQYPLVAINAEAVPTDAERIRKSYPRFQLKTMTGVGHFNMMEDPATFDRLVDESVRGFAAR
jgi:pimeloyl-ACP methyl ester carboxylesterase